MGNTGVNGTMVTKEFIYVYLCVLTGFGWNRYGFRCLRLWSSGTIFECVHEGLVFVRDKEYFDQQDHSAFRKYLLIHALIL